MAEQLAIFFTFVFDQDNIVFFIILVLALLVLVASLFRMRIPQKRLTAISVLLFCLVIIIYNGTILLRKATGEVTVTNYHKLIQQTSKNKAFNDLVFVYLNRNRNQLSGYDFAGLQYKWSKMQPDEK